MTGKGVSEFPDVEAKLDKPTKQSAFERQKAEAEAKRKREAAETAAVYADFLKSFDDDDGGGCGHGNSSRPQAGARPARQSFGQSQVSGGPSRRHFGAAPSGMKSGPGSLGPAPMSFAKKRPFQDFSRPRDQDRERSRPHGFDDQRSNRGAQSNVPKGFEASDDEDMGDAHDSAEERAVAKPTLRLLNLPPGTSPSTIKALMPDYLAVENVKMTPANALSGTERKYTVAIVTCSPETPATDLDSAVSALQNHYMGYGYYLSLHRHLSSTVASAVAVSNISSASNTSHPFGARAVEQPAAPRQAPGQHGFQRGFAPPPSYAAGIGGVSRTNLLHVGVKPPQNIKTIQLINMVIEGILEHGPEFEALLMSRPEVQREEKWAWIWDARSEGGIWLRWRLWEIITGSQSKKNKGKYVPLFDGGHAWKTPEKLLPFEYTTRLDEFVSDSEYNSSDDDEDMDEDNNKKEGAQDADEKSYLNPLEKAKLTHLLARLPASISRLRKGDIARITAFAIMHASRGVDEVVEMIVSNVEQPLSTTHANPERPKESKKNQNLEEDGTNDTSDSSGATLVALYAVSDILSSSSTSGVRHAWRYRQLFEAALQGNKTFEKLGLMSEKFGWGRLRAEKWKRSVGLVLNLWEGWCVFPADSHAAFVDSFDNPPSSKVESKVEEQSIPKGKWKVVEATPKEPIAEEEAAAIAVGDEIAGEPIEDDDVVGEPIDDDDIEGEPIDDDDIEGEPIDDEDVAGEPMDEDEALGEAPSNTTTEKGPAEEPPATKTPRRRMRAVDMFADENSE